MPPLHSTSPEPQSAVAHDPRPELSKEHPLRPQNRPDHPAGTCREWDSPLASSKPVVSSGGLPAPDRIPGHTGKLHLFTKVKVALDAPLKVETRERPKNRACKWKQQEEMTAILRAMRVFNCRNNGRKITVPLKIRISQEWTKV